MRPLFSTLAVLAIAVPLAGSDAGSWYAADGTLSPSAVVVHQLDQ